MMSPGPEGISINGRFERWIMGILATLIALGVVALIVMAIQVGQLANDMGWMKVQFGELKALVIRNDGRLDDIERNGGGH